MNRRKPVAGVRHEVMLREAHVEQHLARPDPPPPPGPPERKKKADRCTGHCCRSFCLQSSPAELAKDLTDPHATDERRLIASMVIYLGEFQSNPTQLVKGESWAQKALNIGLKSDERIEQLQAQMSGTDRHLWRPPGGHYYACRYVLLNGDCGIYENRPQMCRSYPNGHQCAFEACTAPQQTQEQLIATKQLLRKRAL